MTAEPVVVALPATSLPDTRPVAIVPGPRATARPGSSVPWGDEGPAAKVVITVAHEVDLGDDLERAYRRCFAATGTHRRRSTTLAITENFDALWALITLRVEDHRTRQIQRLGRSDRFPADGEIAAATMPAGWAQEWLVQVSIVQGIRWNLPTPVLARLVVATFDGLHTDSTLR